MPCPEPLGEAMRRREFITIAGGAAAWPLVAEAAQQSAMPVIGFLGPGTPQSTTSEVAGFRQGLSESGYIDGRNLKIEYRWAEGKNSQISTLAADLVRDQVAVIAVNGNAAALAAKAATVTIPIVFQVGNDPVAAGLVAGLARPGGNLTGVTTLSAEIVAKRLELLHELLPTISDVALLINPNNRDSENSQRNAEVAAHSLGLQAHVIRAGSTNEIDAAFKGLKQLQAGALIVAADAFFNSRSEQLAGLALQYAIPTIYQYRTFATAGGLISYGANIADAYRLVGVYTAQILKGQKPADLPVQQVTKLELFINLKTAKTLGVNVPPQIQQLADEVIE
jgi:putative tryptophan/tyrosine transport system substrate-binding protein